MSQWTEAKRIQFVCPLSYACSLKLFSSPRVSAANAKLSNLKQTLRRRGGRRQQRISAVLRRFSHTRETDPTIGEMSLAFDTRAFGAFFILFGGLNLVPLPPGTSLLFGIPLVLFTIQLAIGRNRLWLPQRVKERHLSPQTLAKVLDKVGPPLRRVERLARNRYWPMPERVFLSAIGWYCFVMAVLVAIPMPLTNMLPGISIAVAGVAITARDGLWVLASLLIGVLAIIILAGVYGAAAIAFVSFF